MFIFSYFWEWSWKMKSYSENSHLRENQIYSLIWIIFKIKFGKILEKFWDKLAKHSSFPQDHHWETAILILSEMQVVSIIFTSKVLVNFWLIWNHRCRFRLGPITTVCSNLGKNFGSNFGYNKSLVTWVTRLS